MFLQFHSWFVHLYRPIPCECDVDYFASLPDELIINILSRLSKERIVQCQKVCKKWRMLASSSEFVELHRTRIKPLTLMHMEVKGYLKLFIIDGKHRKKKCNLGVLKKLRADDYIVCEGLLKKGPSVNYINSCNGLVLLSSRKHFHKYHVLNPLSAEGRINTIDASDWNLGTHDSCGFFFHPLAKEYRILFWRKVKTDYEYFLYLFGTKTWRRTVNPYFRYQPLNYSDQVIVNGRLHWYLGGNGIMVFDMITEEFFAKLTPVRESAGYKMRNLLVKEDRLCFFNVGSQGMVMDIWILEDYQNWSWTKKYVVDLDWDVIKYPMKEYHIGCEVALNYVNVVSIHKHELILFWRHRGLFSYHLGYNTIKKVYVSPGIPSYFDDQRLRYDTSWNFRTFN